MFIYFTRSKQRVSKSPLLGKKGKNMKAKFSLLLGLVGASMVLASCGGTSSSTPGSSATPAASSAAEGGQSSQAGPESVTPTPSSTSPVTPEEDYSPAYGTKDYSTASWQEKSKILASLETYTLRNHTGGIPLYDDASYEQFSQRALNGLPSRKYLTNYGFGVGYGDFKGSRMMNTAEIDESVEEWKDYFHGYTSTDSGTFNGWDATGADVSDRMSMISSNYFGVKANKDYTSYSWVGSLSRDDAPIMLDAKGNVVSEYGEEDLSQFWRVRVHTGEGYTYHTAPTSKWKSKYDGRQVKLEDYLTPFKAMLDNKLVRASELISDTSGFQGAMTYYYENTKTEDSWSKVGIQLNREENAIEFEFIQPQSMSRARTALSSMLYSPVPAEFLEDIKGAKNYGLRTSGSDNYSVFDNVLVFGAYIPEFWQKDNRLVYKSNEDYFEADDFHYAGYTEDVYAGETGPKNAYEAFQNNKLDEVSIPVEYLEAHKNDTNVLRTEGSTIIKLNVNSTTADEWEYYFGETGTITTHKKKDYWSSEALMANSDFLDGVYFSINRKELADAAGRNPATGYLSNAYMLDPTGTVSYRASDAGKSVLAPYVEASGNEYCYSRDLAGQYFRSAAETLIANGDYDRGDKITVRAVYRYQTTIDNLGKYIKKYIEETFNEYCDGLLTLTYAPEVGGSNYTDAYTRMDHGEFDFAEGAISGNVLNPLDFMNTCSSVHNINQGFNLNWGHRTDIMGEDTVPCYYTDPYTGENLTWAYDALWNASQGFTPVDDGVATPVGYDQSIEESGNNIRYTCYFSQAAVDDDGESVYDFEIKDFALISSANAGGFDGGYYYSDYKFSGKSVRQGGNVSDDAYLFFDIPKSAIEANCKNVAKTEGTQEYFSLYFTILYTIRLDSGISVTKTVNVNIGGALEDYGMRPQSGI